MRNLLTFDCYGTLLDTSPLYDFIGNVAQAHGLSAQKAKYVFSSYEDRLMYGHDFMPYEKLLIEVLSYCDMEMNSDIFAKKYDDVIKIHRDFKPFPDVLPALRQLKQKGYELVVMSNSTHELMKWHMEKLENLLDDSLVAEDTKCYKPTLYFFQQAEKKFLIKEKRHCHIAKGYWWDIVPAKKMGWNKIWVNRTGLLQGRESEQPYITVSDLLKLPQLS